MSHTTIKIEIALENYIDNPYWPETELIVRIQKDSGYSRQKSDEKRKAAIDAQLKKIGMTREQFEAAERKAAERWYRNADGAIVIPRHKLAGMLVQTIGNAPKALRGVFTKDNFRSFCQIGDLTTDRRDKDGVFSRFVKNENSNMRRLQVDEFIGRYLAVGSDQEIFASGTMSLAEAAKPQTLKALVEVGIATIGLGSCRKMGFGLGQLVSFVEQRETKPTGKLGRDAA